MNYYAEISGLLIAGVLALDGLLHALWATGLTWPVRDKLSLAQIVLNINNPRSFRPMVLLPLATLLICAALFVLARVDVPGWMGSLVPDAFLQLAILGVAIGLLARGVAGIGWALGLAASKSKLFYQLNLLLYTPMCFILFIAAVVVAAS